MSRKPPRRLEFQPASDADARLGAALAPEFEVLRPVGRGTTATVYLARETALRRLVAVKVPRPELAEDERVRRRFEREATAAARVRHPSAVAIHRIGRLPDGTPFLVMDYLEGRTLEEVLHGEGALPQPVAARLLAQLASALAAATERGVIHRDVRAANVILTDHDERAVLTDFGIAGILESGGEAVTRLTRMGETLGSREHMSPEQLLGEPLTAATDVYGLGLLGYEMLTRRQPYDAETPVALAAAHLHEAPRPLTELLPDADAQLAETLGRCLARTPQHRPRAASVAQAMGSIARGGAGSGTDGAGEPHAGGPVASAVARFPAFATFLRELRRRHVYNVAVVYVAAAFLGLQVAELIVPVLPAADRVYAIVVTVVVAGFPLTLVLAWLYDITGSGIRRTQATSTSGSRWVRILLPVIGLVVSLVLAGLIGWLILG